VLGRPFFSTTRQEPRIDQMIPPACPVKTHAGSYDPQVQLSPPTRLPCRCQRQRQGNRGSKTEMAAALGSCQRHGPPGKPVACYGPYCGNSSSPLIGPLVFCNCPLPAENPGPRASRKFQRSRPPAAVVKRAANRVPIKVHGPIGTFDDGGGFDDGPLRPRNDCPARPTRFRSPRARPPAHRDGRCAHDHPKAHTGGPSCGLEFAYRYDG